MKMILLLHKMINRLKSNELIEVNNDTSVMDNDNIIYAQ